MSKVTIYRPVTAQRWRYDVINGTRTGPYADGVFVLNSVTRVKDAVDTPNYRAKIAAKQRLPMNQYFLSRETAGMPQGSPHLKIVWVPTGDYSEYVGPANIAWDDIRYLEPDVAQRQKIADRLAQRCLEKLKDQKVNLGNFIAERNQAIQMFGDTAGKVARAFNAVKRRQFKKAFEELGCRPSKRLSGRQSAANNWLQLQYGWLPLLDDVYGTAEELERSFGRQTKERPPLMKVVAKGRLQDADKYYSVSPASVGAWAERAYMYDARVILYYTVDYQSSQWLGRVGLTNPLSIAWEVLPYSFVVDWFLPVGNFLNTLDATLGVSFVDGANSGTTYTHLVYSRSAKYTQGNYRYEWNMNRTARARYFKYERGSMSGFPGWNLPQLKNPISAKHCANALALLTQAFKSK